MVWTIHTVIWVSKGNCQVIKAPGVYVLGTHGATATTLSVKYSDNQS